MQQEPIWNQNLDRPTFQPVMGDQHYDVVVIGGGMTGVMTALRLKRAGRKVALVEARTIGSGVSGATTAHITQLLDDRYTTIIKTFGEDRARLVAESARVAIDTIETFARDNNIDCDFQRVPGYLYAEPDQDQQEIEQEIEAMQQLQMPVQRAADLPLPIPHIAALRVENQAQFHPLKFLYGLVQLIPGDGSAVFEHSRVTDVEDGEPCKVHTESGVLSAPNVVLATHTPFNEKFLDHARIAANRSYVLALDTGKDAPDALLWDIAEPYHYTRSAVIDGRKVLIVGGADHKTGQEEDTETHYDDLVRYAYPRFGDATVVARWSSQVYEPADGLAYIGLQPFMKHVYMATGFSGNGMTYSAIAALILSDELTGKSNAYAEIYDSQRNTITTGGEQILAEGANIAVNAVKSFLRSDAKEFSEVPAGEGRVLRMGTKQVAAYRADDGTLTVLSANCTHAGCVVGWNTAERSWDCPCHGGRFSPTGKVIEGPPVKPLTPVDAAE